MTITMGAQRGGRSKYSGRPTGGYALGSVLGGDLLPTWHRRANPVTARQTGKTLHGRGPCPGILPPPTTVCYMFVNREARDEYVLFDHSARASRKVCTRNARVVMTSTSSPGIVEGWQEVGMYSLTIDERREMYFGTPPSVARHEGRRILPCPSPLLFNYELCTYHSGDSRFKTRLERVLDKETIDLLMGSFIHAVQYDIWYSRQDDVGSR